MKKKNEKNPVTGTFMFNGTFELTLNGKKYKVRAEYFGLDMQRASQEHPIIVLLKQHLPFDEIDVGYLVRTKAYDEKHVFGLKERKNDRSWSVYNYNDVIAWGYADGGLNSDHFNSCRLRPEDYPQFAGKPSQDNDDIEYDDDDDLMSRRGVIFRYDKETDKMTYHANVAASESMTENATDLMRDAAKAFCDFRDKRPEITEMRFYTDELLDM